MYESFIFLQYSIHLNFIFVCTQAILHLKLNNAACSSFYAIWECGNFLPPQNARYSYLGSTFHTCSSPVEDHECFAVCLQTAERSMVPALYSRLLPLHFVNEHYITYFNAVWRENDPYLDVENVEFTAETTTDEVIWVQEYGGTHNVNVQTNFTGDTLLDRRPRLPLFLHSLNVLTGGPFQSHSSVVQISRNHRTHCSWDVRDLYAFWYINLSPKISEKWALRLLYPHGEIAKPFDLGTFFQAK